jgi:hypothetical protein
MGCDGAPATALLQRRAFRAAHCKARLFCFSGSESLSASESIPTAACSDRVFAAAAVDVKSHVAKAHVVALDSDTDSDPDSD